MMNGWNSLQQLHPFLQEVCEVPRTVQFCIEYNFFRFLNKILELAQLGRRALEVDRVEEARQTSSATSNGSIQYNIGGDLSSGAQACIQHIYCRDGMGRPWNGLVGSTQIPLSRTRERRIPRGDTRNICQLHHVIKPLGVNIEGLKMWWPVTRRSNSIDGCAAGEAVERVRVSEKTSTSRSLTQPALWALLTHAVCAWPTSITSSANDLFAAHSALIPQVRTSQQNHRRQLRYLQFPPSEILELPLIPSSPPSPVDQDSPPASPPQPPQFHADLPPTKRARVARYNNYVSEEETIRNDYFQRYVDGGEWPQNWVLDADPEHRFEEYPKQQRLLALKKASVNTNAVAPSYLPFAELASLHPVKFDVILLDPPFSTGAGEGLESGREVLAKWGYYRCEDVVWVRTNKIANRGPGTDVLQPSYKRLHSSEVNAYFRIPAFTTPLFKISAVSMVPRAQGRFGGYCVESVALLASLCRGPTEG
ncbi:hypothetical protein FB451DRAFT_1361374 [Mycena latifolia]|nr:hypothetical protein FB451DRAFT_1361374 [Mycena latifolia]